MTKKGLSSVRMVTLYNYGIILYDMILVKCSDQVLPGNDRFP